MSGSVLTFFPPTFSLSHTSEEAMGAGNSSHHYYLRLRRGASPPSPPPSPPPAYESIFGVASQQHQYEQIDDEVVHSPLRRVSGPRRTDAHFWRGRRRPPAFDFSYLTPRELTRRSPLPPYSPPRFQPPPPPPPPSPQFGRPISPRPPSAPPPPPPLAVSPSSLPQPMRESTRLLTLAQPSSSLPPPRDERLVMSLRWRDARLALLGHSITAMTREMAEREVREQETFDHLTYLYYKTFHLFFFCFCNRKRETYCTVSLAKRGTCGRGRRS
jgi:hypothetical protein